MMDRNNLFESAAEDPSGQDSDRPTSSRARVGVFDSPLTDGGGTGLRTPAIARGSAGRSSPAPRTSGHRGSSCTVAGVGRRHHLRRGPVVATIVVATGAVGIGTWQWLVPDRPAPAPPAADPAPRRLQFPVSPPRTAGRSRNGVHRSPAKRRDRERGNGERSGVERRRETPARRDARRHRRRAVEPRPHSKRASGASLGSAPPAATPETVPPASARPSAVAPSPPPSSVPAAGAARSSHAPVPDAREFGIE
jgi:hypothetical protein